MLKVFVYGTLKPGESNYLQYCAGKVIEEEPAIAFGRIFHLPSCGYPAMTIGDRKVQGYLLSFADPNVLPDLDRLEDYNPHRPPEKNLYNRQQIKIFDRQERSLGLAWAYFMMPEQVERLEGVDLPSGCWTGRYSGKE